MIFEIIQPQCEPVKLPEFRPESYGIPLLVIKGGNCNYSSARLDSEVFLERLQKALLQNGWTYE